MNLNLNYIVKRFLTLMLLLFPAVRWVLKRLAGRRWRERRTPCEKCSWQNNYTPGLHPVCQTNACLTRDRTINWMWWLHLVKVYCTQGSVLFNLICIEWENLPAMKADRFLPEEGVMLDADLPQPLGGSVIRKLETDCTFELLVLEGEGIKRQREVWEEDECTGYFPQLTNI